MASPDFTHLHCHTEYSLLDGLARVGPLMDAAVRQGMTSLALTDHGVMFGAIDFYKAAKDRGIKPIIGCETYVSPRGMEQREGKQDASGYHFVLLAENETGYRNLLTLTSEAQLRGFYYKPRVDKELLAQHSDGLIALSACLSSEVARHLLRDELDAAEKAARWYAEVFDGRFYLELQDHGIKAQHTVNDHIVAMARRLGLPLVVTNDVHYINREHAYAQEVLLCIQTGTTVDAPKRMKMDSQEFYLKSAQEMWDRFGAYPEALKNTMAIAERCNLNLEFGRVQLPTMPVPAGHSVDSHLAAICHQRLAERYTEVTPEIRARLDYELSVIKKTGFSAYFLLLEDIIGYARREGIMVGPGRGSAVGSLASYCLGITNVDPLPLDLLFERFLNPDRLSMPDIDTDFSDDRRDEVIRYITDRFGADKVAQISTFGTMAARAAVKDVGRALGIPYGDVERVAKLIPPKSDLKGALEVAELRELYETTDYVRTLLDTAQQLEDVKRHNSTHAAGVVISAEPLVNVTPLVRVGKEGEQGQATQFEAPILDKIGLLKMDILGLTTLSLIQRTIHNIEKTTGHVIYTDEIPLDDPCIYTLLTSAETAGIFQLESGGMRKVLRDMKPDRFTDIVAAVALYRPGPMAFIDQYNRRKNGQEKITYLHPDLEPILSDSYGVLVYQDQVLKIALQFAGMTWGEVDKLRKAMGKKLAEEMKKQQAAFEEGFTTTTQWQYQQDEHGAPVARQVPKPSYPVALARDLWPLIETFAGYGFNKCLSAKTYIKLSDGTRMHISAAYKDPPNEIMSMWPDGTVRPHKVARIVKTGRKALFKVTTQSGKVIRATAEHRLLTTEGYQRIADMHIRTELITVPRRTTENQRHARCESMTRLNKSVAHRQRVSARVARYQVSRPLADKIAHMKRMHTLYPDIKRIGVAAMQERVKWLYANDPAWKEKIIQASLANTRACYDTGPGYGRCSIASNGMWCASQPERDMCEWLIAQDTEFEMHKTLPTGRMCDFYFAGIYWEMDGMDRAPAYFAQKYGDLPYVVVTPEDFKLVVEHHLALQHAENGDAIVSIELAEEDQTYDIEMAPDGPLNFIANEVVSHNSHAAAYAQLACQTAYLKAKYPVQYMAACLSIETGAPDRMAVVLGECRRLGIAIRPPDVNHSEMDFAVEGDGIRYALQAVKNVGANAIRSIVEAREKGGPFRDLDDFCRRVEWKSLNKRALESLIKAGALDSLRGGNQMDDRALLLGNLDRICSQAQRAERAAQMGQVSLFAAVGDAAALEAPALSLAPMKEVEHKQLLAWEKEMLGIYVSPHPLAAFQEQGRRLGAISISALGPERAGKRVKLGVQIASMRQIVTKKSETMLVMELADLEGSVEAVAFPRTYSRFRELWAEDAILLVDGTVDMRNDRLQVIVEEAAVFEHKVSTGAGWLRLYAPRSGDDEDDRRRLVELYLLLREFPGADRFELLIDDNGRRTAIEVPDDTVCCCPELLQRLRDAFPDVQAEEIAALTTAATDLDDGLGPMLTVVEYDDDPFADASDADANLVRAG